MRTNLEKFISLFAMNAVKYIVGLLDPMVLAALESDFLNPAVGVTMGDLSEAYSCCNAVEIRYDWFNDFNEWPNLSLRVRQASDRLNQKMLQIGTIRLTEDGGNFPKEKASSRLALWEHILESDEIPDLFDLEFEYLESLLPLRSKIAERRKKILLSAHDFKGMPSETELEKMAQQALSFGASGFKLAAMSTTIGDCEVLYRFILKYAADFEYMGVFAMGETGRASRLLSYSFGANLSYASLSKTPVPGQIPAVPMQNILSQLKNTNIDFDAKTLKSTIKKNEMKIFDLLKK